MPYCTVKYCQAQATCRNERNASKFRGKEREHAVHGMRAPFPPAPHLGLIIKWMPRQGCGGDHEPRLTLPSPGAGGRGGPPGAGGKGVGTWGRREGPSGAGGRWARMPCTMHPPGAGEPTCLTWGSPSSGCPDRGRGGTDEPRAPCPPSTPSAGRGREEGQRRGRQ